MSADRAELLREALRVIAKECPRLVAIGRVRPRSRSKKPHRESFDLDFHTQHPFVDTRAFLAELQRAFPGKLEIVQAPDARGSGFSAVIESRGERMTLQVFAAFDDVPEGDLVRATTAPGLRRITLQRYLADKVQCLVERIEARDLVDIHAALHARRSRLGWTDDAIIVDLKAYSDVNPADAVTMRDEILALLKRATP
jgi:hypothetical protein